MRGRFRFSSLENLFWKTSKVKLSLHSINTILRKKKEHWHQKIQWNFNKLDGNCSAYFPISFTQFRFHCLWMVIEMCSTPGSPGKWLTEPNRTKQADALDYKKDLIPKDQIWNHSPLSFPQVILSCSQISSFCLAGLFCREEEHGGGGREGSRRREFQSKKYWWNATLIWSPELWRPCYFITSFFPGFFWCCCLVTLQ